MRECEPSAVLCVCVCTEISIERQTQGKKMKPMEIILCIHETCKYACAWFILTFIIDKNYSSFLYHTHNLDRVPRRTHFQFLRRNRNEK